MNSTGSFIDQILGDSSYIWFQPGFIRLNAGAISAVALFAPVVIDVTIATIRHRVWINDRVIDLTRTIKNSFTPQPGEPPDVARNRILWNIAKVGGALLLVTTAVLSIYVLIKLGIVAALYAAVSQALSSLTIVQTVQGMCGGINIWNLAIPQTARLVHAGYSLLTVGHLAQAYRHGEENGPRTLFHLFGAALSAVTTVAMLGGHYETRWHHMSYGLLMMLSPFRSMRFFGTAMALDSTLYWIKPGKDNFDFSNIFVSHPIAFVVQMAALSTLELCVEKLPDLYDKLRGGIDYGDLDLTDML